MEEIAEIVHKCKDCGHEVCMNYTYLKKCPRCDSEKLKITIIGE